MPDATAFTSVWALAVALEDMTKFLQLAGARHHAVAHAARGRVRAVAVVEKAESGVKASPGLLGWRAAAWLGLVGGLIRAARHSSERCKILERRNAGGVASAPLSHHPASSPMAASGSDSGSAPGDRRPPRAGYSRGSQPQEANAAARTSVGVAPKRRRNELLK